MKSIMYPSLPPHNWDEEEFGELQFNRDLLNLFSQPNDHFGAKLLDALWSYQTGNQNPLDQIVKKGSGGYMSKNQTTKGVFEVLSRDRQDLSGPSDDDEDEDEDLLVG